MRKEIRPEMYNYNKYPGRVFVTFDEVVKSDDIVLSIVKNTSDRFDAEVFSQRFSDILLKYDYIVGDWGQGQLRLRGFYKEDSQQPPLTKISRLDDYIKEYCNFGCAYFVLANPQPQEILFEIEEAPRRRRQRRRPKYSDKRRRDDKENEEAVSKLQPFKKKNRDRRPRQEQGRGGTEKQGNFTIRQKGKNQ